MRRAVVVLAILFVLGLGIGAAIYFTVRKEESPLPVRQVTAAMTQERGERPSGSRLPKGLKQIEDPNRALDLARESLSRVEKELAAAQDDKARATLERKKQFIEKAIERLEGQ